jgi:Tat protein secretion system quality control protein TatD with DNase activity
VTHVAAAIAELHGTKVAEVAQLTGRTAAALFFTDLAHG